MKHKLVKALSILLMIPIITIALPFTPQANAWGVSYGRYFLGCDQYDAGGGVSCLRCYYGAQADEGPGFTSWEATTGCSNGTAFQEH